MSNPYFSLDSPMNKRLVFSSSISKKKISNGLLPRRISLLLCTNRFLCRVAVLPLLGLHASGLTSFTYNIHSHRRLQNEGHRAVFLFKLLPRKWVDIFFGSYAVFVLQNVLSDCRSETRNRCKLDLNIELSSKKMLK